MQVSELYEAKKRFFKENHYKLSQTVGIHAIHAFTAIELFVDYLASEMCRESSTRNHKTNQRKSRQD